ncbi:pyridoxamine 5'-phosphate oxidase family protein [Bacillus sp. 1NLA3E]|uniref:pyridoxamine 5'-phosphate oxidase family protein n=1 Tax=Bacillus sp. 1NLA3E TaxID=666686 RepID=UPI000247EE70|nr:pyridoxamine 5'-phosphate oxidase family protein [Bacillus sp. 1NLA3E]
MSHRAMRRILKEVKDEGRINDLLSSEKVGYLGLNDDEGTYVVPLNFVWKDQKIYFHGSEQGRKADAMRNGKRICFTVSEDRGTIANPAPANIGTAYTSVMVFGYVKKLDDLDESTDALQAMLEKFVPGYFERKLSQKYVDSYRSSLGSKTIIYCVEPDQITAKEAVADQDLLFFPGRKQTNDLKKDR